MVNEQRALESFPFDSFRPFQQEILLETIEALESGIEHVAINAPVGFGKSPEAIALCNYFGSGYIGTTQKSLQTQYCNDFQLPLLMGKTNYDCTLHKGLKCDNPTCPKPKCVDCPYVEARNECLDNNISIMNYSLMFSLKMYSPLLEKRPIAVYDECHNLESQLTDFIGLNISTRTFKQYSIALLMLPPANSSMIDVIKWLHGSLLPHLQNNLVNIKVALDGYPDESARRDLGKQYGFLDRFVCQINRMIKFISEGGKVCIQITEDTVSVKPLLVDTFAPNFLSSIAEKTVHISATIQSKDLYCRCLGIDPDNLKYISVGSVFPPENRPVYFAGIGKMNYKEKSTTLPKMSKAIDKIISSAKHKNQRGIIHTSTYDIAQYIYDHSSYHERLVFPNARNKELLLKEFYESERDDLILISPSLMEGIDLKGDLAEWSIVCKVPFASLGDDWVKQKMDAIDGWYTEETINKLVQSTGRHIRSETEKGITYILDETFRWFYNSNKFRFPKWWTESLIMK